MVPDNNITDIVTANAVYSTAAEQCYGFASKMFYLTFGIYQENAEKIYSINDVCAGDVIRYGGTAGHSVFVIKVNRLRPSIMFTVTETEFLVR